MGLTSLVKTMIATHFTKGAAHPKLKGGTQPWLPFPGHRPLHGFGGKGNFFPWCTVLLCMYHDFRLFSEDILTAFYHHISLHVPI